MKSMESEINGCGIGNLQTWNPESGIHSVESGIQDSLGLPYMGRTLGRPLFLTRNFHIFVRKLNGCSH